VFDSEIHRRLSFGSVFVVDCSGNFGNRFWFSSPSLLCGDVYIVGSAPGPSKHSS